MRKELPIANGRLPVDFGAAARCGSTDTLPPGAGQARGFSLVEVLVVVSLLSLIVLALMAVFSGTQQAFRASVTQIDVLQSGRATVDLMASDLRQMAPSGGVSNGPVNFCALANSASQALYSPLVQTMPGSMLYRTNRLNWFFVLGRQNTQWIGVGYVVDSTNSSLLYPLYRFYAMTNLQTSPVVLFNAFKQAVDNSQWASLSYVMDGVVHLAARAFDTNGVWMNNNLNAYTNAQNVLFFPPADGETQCYMFSNTIPAAVELQLGVLEDRILQRAQSLPTPARRAQYLADKSGNVHLFLQRVTIQNVDTTAYQ